MSIIAVTQPRFRPPSRVVSNLSTGAIIKNYFSSGGGYWDLNDSPGDSSGNGNALTEVGTPGYSIDGKPPNCIQLIAASTQYLNLADNDSLSMGAGVSFSVGGWAKMASGGGSRRIVAKGNLSGAAGCEYSLGYNAASRFNMVASDGSSVVTATDTSVSVSLNTWYFVVGVVDLANSLVKVCVNAGSFFTAAFTGPVQDSTNAFRIGNDTAGGTRLWDGYLDSVFVVKRALTSDEITYLYNSGTGREWGTI